MSLPGRGGGGGLGWGASFCHDLQAGLNGALGEIGVRVEAVQWPRQERLRVLMRPCIQSGWGEGRGPCECVGVDEASQLPSLCLRLQYVLVMLSEESCTAEVAGFHEIWCSAPTLMFLSEWLVEAEEGADGDGVGYTTGEGQSGTGDPPCDFESTQDAKAGDKPLSKKRNEHTDIH